ncbi:phage baseplate protein [Paraburkholderia sediminicola]|uniref:phage baseplate protein n=1 Tax=Paraburkholderia sediminicola TaxID=458836 RepID=UPI0038BA9DB3
MSVLGNAVAAGQILIQLLTQKPQRGFDDGSGNLFVPDATIEEVHTDDLEITDHPVEQGTAISDHAFKRPSELIVTAGWSDSPNNSGLANQIIGAAANASSALQTIIGAARTIGGIVDMFASNGSGSPSQAAYQQLLAMQENRTLFTIYTGKRIYRNMLVKSLATTTDAKTENSLIIRIGCRQILMAQTQTVTVPDSSNMANPEQNGATVNNGVKYPLPSPNINTTALPQFNSSGQQV